MPNSNNRGNIWSVFAFLTFEKYQTPISFKFQKCTLIQPQKTNLYYIVDKMSRFDIIYKKMHNL